MLDFPQDLGMKVVYLMNDFEAQGWCCLKKSVMAQPQQLCFSPGYGILTLEPQKDCDILQDAPLLPGAPIALLGAGTGLGEAFMTTGENGDYEASRNDDKK